MVALFFLGWAIERKVNRILYIIAYFLGGVVGALSILIPVFNYPPEMPAIGASAAISGLVGLGTFMIPGKFVLFPTIIPLPFVVAGAIYFLATVSNIFVPSEIGYPGHLLGILAGALIGLIFGKDRMKRLFVFVFILILISALPLIVDYILFLI
jgi:membrane associated rhomboid family serine protease